MNKNNLFTFSPQKTQWTKGIAILLMVWHHLFAFPDRIKDVSYQSMKHVNGIPIEQWIGEFGKLCVAIFLFLSGYGLYKVYQKHHSFTFQDSLKRIISFLKTYYIIFFVFIPIGLIFFRTNPDFQWNTTTFLYNFFALKATYNGEWWFVPLYLMLIILFPFIIKGVQKNSTVVTYCSFVGFYLASFMMGMRADFPNHEFIQLLLYHLAVLLGWQLIFMTGILCAKFSFFEKSELYLKKLHLDNKFFYLIILLGCYYIRQILLKDIIEIGDISFQYNNYNIADFILAPIFILAFTKLINGLKFLEMTFAFLGKHSTVIWLTHSFFSYYYFQSFTYVPKYSLLIVLWIFTITITISYFINLLLTFRSRLISKKHSTFPGKLS